MHGSNMSPEDLRRVCGQAKYDVILNGDAYAVRNATTIPRSDNEWPAILLDMDDESILPLLTGAMLGPSQEFSEIKVVGKGKHPHTIYANLTRYVQSSSSLTLTLYVLRASDCS